MNEPTPTISPTDILMNLIAVCLAPMFLTASGGDLAFARMAAIETVNAYRARDILDLIPIAQVIACGLTALGSLSLSMADSLSLSMTLRLRGNAVALNRSAEQNRRTLTATRPWDCVSHQADTVIETPFAPGSDDAKYEAQVMASVAAAQTLTAQVQGHWENLGPAAIQPPTLAAAPPAATLPSAAFATPIPAVALSIAVPSKIPTAVRAPAAAPALTQAAIPPFAACPAADPVITERQRQAMWAFAMTDVAAEYTAELKNLPPTQRKIASRRAEALSTCANQLLLGNVPPQLKPDDLAAILRQFPAR